MRLYETLSKTRTPETPLTIFPSEALISIFQPYELTIIYLLCVTNCLQVNLLYDLILCSIYNVRLQSEDYHQHVVSVDFIYSVVSAEK